MSERITYQKALELMKMDKSQMLSVNRHEHLALHPRYIGDLKSGVVSVLDTYMSLYHDRFDGVPLAYNNVKMIQSVAEMIAYQPYLHFDVTADFIVFKPNIGSSLKGVIQKVEKDHISCLVHKTFNAWCPKEPLVAAIESSDPLAIIGCEIEFTVNKVSSNNGVMSLRGAFKKILKRPPKIIPDPMETPINKRKTFDDEEDEESQDIDQSFCPALTSTQIETPFVPSAKKRKRKLSVAFEEETSFNKIDSAGTSEDVSDSYSKHKKKRKKHKHGKEEVEEKEETVVIKEQIKTVDEESVEKVEKKHKKHKKVKSESFEGVNGMEEEKQTHVKEKKKKKKHEKNKEIETEAVDFDLKTGDNEGRGSNKKHVTVQAVVNGVEEAGEDSLNDFVDISQKKHKKKKKHKKQE